MVENNNPPPPKSQMVGSESTLAYRGSDAVIRFLRAVESTKALQNKQVRLTLAEAEELGAELRSPRAVDVPSAAPHVAVINALRTSLDEILPMAEEYWANPDEVGEIVRARAALASAEVEG